MSTTEGPSLAIFQANFESKLEMSDVIVALNSTQDTLDIRKGTVFFFDSLRQRLFACSAAVLVFTVCLFVRHPLVSEKDSKDKKRSESRFVFFATSFIIAFDVFFNGQLLAYWEPCEVQGLALAVRLIPATCAFSQTPVPVSCKWTGTVYVPLSPCVLYALRKAGVACHCAWAFLICPFRACPFNNKTF